MVLVAILACDSLAIRALTEVDRPEALLLILLGGVPTANVLLLGLRPIARGWMQRQDTRPVLIGFEVAGCAALLSYVAISLVAPDFMLDLLEKLLEAILTPILRGFGVDEHDDSGPLIVISFLAAAFLLSVPQIALAVAGGLFTRRYEVRLVIRRRGRRSDGPGPAGESPTGATAVLDRA
jgi:hypothetical protein